MGHGKIIIKILIVIKLFVFFTEKKEVFTHIQAVRFRLYSTEMCQNCI